MNLNMMNLVDESDCGDNNTGVKSDFGNYIRMICLLNLKM